MRLDSANTRQSSSKNGFSMRPLKHLTPIYVIDRTAVTVWQRRHPKAPWLTARSTDLLDGWLRDSDTVFEWGSGRSTVWFAQRVSRVISVEHDAEWYTSVGKQLSRPKSAVERHLVNATESIQDQASRDYVSVIDALDDETIDVALVDGRVRDECALRALPKLRRGGLLVLDNADWFFVTGTRTPASKWDRKLWSDAWARFDSAVAGWRRIVTTNGVWDTVLWIKPPSLSVEAPLEPHANP